jgi:hypothetical protein
MLLWPALACLFFLLLHACGGSTQTESKPGLLAPFELPAPKKFLSIDHPSPNKKCDARECDAPGM